uniref:Retrovirus-related Pol polyprotein from transposon TNT 1-94 n=1 Tax=Cajanus cajan TaxID=3821 RepID=A0A151RSE1_CAJCA|nr:Retrovirus-related Pol polyprotein from transposon TNT 1-94 [Cajanus cajan]
MVEFPVKEANSVSDDVGHSSTLWHHRLGHMSEKGTKILVSRGKIPELKEVEVGFCEPCVFWKLIPEEEWQSKDVSLSHLKVFGCVSYVRVRDADRDKLNPKARKCIFIGYEENDMGYRFWDDQNRKIIRSRDVTFNENTV